MFFQTEAEIQSLPRSALVPTNHTSNLAHICFMHRLNLKCVDPSWLHLLVVKFCKVLEVNPYLCSFTKICSGGCRSNIYMLKCLHMQLSKGSNNVLTVSVVFLCSLRFSSFRLVELIKCGKTKGAALESYLSLSGCFFSVRVINYLTASPHFTTFWKWSWQQRLRG